VTSESYHVRLQDWEILLLAKYHMAPRSALYWTLMNLSRMDPAKVDEAMKEAAAHAAAMKKFRKAMKP